VALLLGDKTHQRLYLTALQRSMKNLKTLQYTKADCKDVKFPKRCTGAFRPSVTSKWSRVDTGQHIMDAFRKLIAIGTKP